MNLEQLRAETIKRTSESDPDLAGDESEIDKRLEPTRKDLLDEAEKEAAHYERVASEAVEDHKRQEYQIKSAAARDKAESWRALKIA